MARLFGALANAGAQVNTNRFKRQQYDDQQAAQARDEARRVFEFAATQDRLKEQAALNAQLRQDQLTRQNQNDQRAAIENGFEDTPVESLAAASQAYMQSQGMGMPQQAVRAPQTARRVQDVEGVDASAAQKGAPAYTNVGGRVMRYDPQREANNEADVRKSKLMEQFAMRRDVAQENAKAAAEARGQQALQLEALRQSGRRDMISLAATLKGAQAQQPQPASEKLTSDLATLKDIADQAEYAMSLVQKTRGTAGPVAAGGRLLRKLTLRSPTGGDMAAAEYQRVTADLRKKLFGAAQSVRELRSASEFLPMLESSNDEFVSNALRGIGTAARKAAQNRLAATQAGGRGVGGLGGYADQFPAFDAPGVKAPVRPDAASRSKGAPVPNRVPVPWETKK